LKYCEGKKVSQVDINRYLEEGKRYIEQQDSVQASEKLYKAAEGR
jgi:hypothetical protein